MRGGDTIPVRYANGGAIRGWDVINPNYVEARELEPLSFAEAKAMVLMLGGAHAMRPMSPGVGMKPMRHQVTPLQILFASLPPWSAWSVCGRRRRVA